MLPLALLSVLLTARNPHPCKARVSLTRMNHSTNSHEAVPSAPQTETEVKAWMPELTEERIALFNSSIDKSGGSDACWPWTKSINGDGYGRFFSGRGSTTKAHRIAYALNVGPVPLGLCVMHSCDNRPCCNPKHLGLGTISDNIKDMHRKGRCTKIQSGETHSLAKLDKVKVVEIRARFAVGGISCWALAKEYGVNHKTISKVVRRLTWKNVA